MLDRVNQGKALDCLLAIVQSQQEKPKAVVTVLKSII